MVHQVLATTKLKLVLDAFFSGRIQNPAPHQNKLVFKHWKKSRLKNYNLNHLFQRQNKTIFLTKCKELLFDLKLTLFKKHMLELR